jgi:hypothetical protein
MADPTGILINIAIQAAIRLAIAALTPKQHEEGPRLDDLTLTTSTYGQVIPLGYGNSLLAGNIIWGREIREEAVTEEIGKGNPFSLGTMTYYYYYGTLAVGIAAREAAELVRIYADGKLIYATDIDAGPDKMEGLSFRFYTGSATQEPDPLMLADFPDDEVPAYRGLCYIVFDDMPLENFANRIPQFQFVVTFAPIYQEALAVSSEITGASNGYVPSLQQLVIDETRDTHFLIGMTTASILTADYYVAEVDNRTGQVLQSKSLITISEEAGFLYTDEAYLDYIAAGGDPDHINLSYFSSDPDAFYGVDGPYIVMGKGSGSSDIHVVLAKDTLAVLGRSDEPFFVQTVYGTDPVEIVMDGTYVGRGKTLISTSGGGMVVPVKRGTTTAYYFAAFASSALNLPLWDSTDTTSSSPFNGSNRNRGFIALHSLPSLAPINYTEPVDDPYYGGLPSYGIHGYQLGYQGNGFTHFYTLHRRSSSIGSQLHLVRTRVEFGGIITSQVTMNIEGGGDYLTHSTGLNPGLVFYDESCDMLIFRAAVTVGYFMNSLGADDTLAANEMRRVWVRPEDAVTGPGNTPEQVHYNKSGGTFAVQTAGTSPAAGSVTIIDSATGATVEVLSIDPSVQDINTGDSVTWLGTTKFYDETTGKTFFILGGWFVGWYPFQGPVARGVETLQTVVEDICFRSKLTPDLVNASALASKQINGYTINRETTFRAALEPLATAYNFYAVEKNGQLVFEFKDATTDVTIVENDFVGSLDGSAIFEEARGQDAELPRALYVEYQSLEFKDEALVQGVRRSSVPDSTMSSVGEIRVQLPLILSDTEAMGVATRLMYESWVGQETFKFRLPQRYLHLLPNDMLAVTAEGRTENMRIEKVTVGASLEIEVEARLADGAVYTLNSTPVSAIGSPNYGRTDEVINSQPARATGYILDMPLLLDGTGPARDAGALMQVVGGPLAGSSNFGGVAVLTSTNGQPYVQRATVTTPMAWGVVQSAIPAHPGAGWNAVQEASITIGVLYGQSYFTSVSEEDMIGTDANTAILYEASTGRVEIIGFRDAAIVTNNELTSTVVTGLMRGKRGTDAIAIEGMTGGVYFIIANSSWVFAYVEANSLLGTDASYVTKALGGRSEYSPPLPLTYEHRSLKPYAPSNVAGVINSPTPGDVTLSWQRRTREGGAWLPYQGTVPLAEDSEAYQVDILSGSGGAVLRTLSSTTNSVVYTDEQANTDFGSGGVPPTLYVRVYQISAQVGRGFSNEVALELE